MDLFHYTMALTDIYKAEQEYEKCFGGKAK